MTLIALVCDSVSSQHSKRAYRRAVEEFFSWCRMSRYTAFTKASLQEYRTVLESLGLAAATVNLRISRFGSWLPKCLTMDSFPKKWRPPSER